MRTTFSRAAWFTILALLCSRLFPGSAQGQEPVRVWEVSPAAEPLPALHYRFTARPLLGADSDAAPVYLRLAHELQAGQLSQAFAAASEMLNLNDEAFSANDAQKLVQPWESRLEQIRLGSLRRKCDWGYTLDEQREGIIDILLPDAQSMRGWGRLLAVKARMQIANGDHEGAAQTIGTGLRFAQHVGEGPFLINGLVAIAIAEMMIDQLERFVAMENSPNTYWAIATMPRPLISLRDAMEMEHGIVEVMIPEVERMEQLGTNGEWEYLFRRLTNRINELVANQAEFVGPDEELVLLKDPRKALAKPARTFLTSMKQWTAKDVGQMSDEQAISLYLIYAYHDLRDTLFRGTYLDYPDAFRVHGRATREFEKKAARYPGTEVFKMLMAAAPRAQVAEARIERRLAILRAGEALRMHASETGKFPQSLLEVKLVPVPVDPLTKFDWDYRREGNLAILATPSLLNAFSDADVPFLTANDEMRMKHERFYRLRNAR